MGLSSRIITLGQFLTTRKKNSTRPLLIEELIEAGLTNFLFSVHAVEEERFARITGESFARQKAAMTRMSLMKSWLSR